MAELDVILGVVEDIKQEVEEVAAKCDQLLEFRAVHTEAHKTIEARQSEFKKTLYGDDNGTGLTYKVEKLIQCKKSFKSAADRWSGFWIGLLRMLAAAAIVGITAWLLSIYSHDPNRASQGETSQPASSEAAP